MRAELWARVESVYGAAVLRPAADRARFVAEACAGDEALRSEVASLLAQITEDPDFLETPLVDVARILEPAAESADAAMRIGTYVVVRPLGRGGMGDVFLALHPQTGQHVAVKVIRRGLDSEEIVARFAQERRILASLEHPHIARLLDAGTTTEGLPYFVMEYAEGEPIDTHCDRLRLGVAHRVRLVIEVCHAVQHAHGHLVVHRDIKPSNILVTSAGSTKLLDFGIGKVLDPPWTVELEASARTGSQIRMLTPEYASPEQVRGERVTTATDVHGLGLLLYRLSTGRSAFAASTAQALERAILEEEPVRPSARVEGSTRRALAGDLDTIVLKALRKEPDRRYASAAALAEDLERHLDGRPVHARPDTFGYRTAKFVRRNPWGVAAGVVSVAALAGFSMMTGLHARQVERERDEALEVRGFLLEGFGAASPDGSNEPLAARVLLDQQAATMEYVYGDRPELRAEMLQVLADAYERLGLYEQAEMHARAALLTLGQMPESDAVDLASATALLGWIRVQQDAAAEADSLLVRAVELFREGGASGRRGLARALNDLGVLYQQQGNLDEAERVLDESLALRTRYFERDSRALGTTANNVAGVRYGKGDYEGALAGFEQSLDALRRSVGPDHQRSVIAQSNVATVHLVLGDWVRAERELTDLLERQSRTQGRTHPVTTRMMHSLATALSNQGKYAEAVALYREALAAQDSTLGPTHAQVGVTLRGLATALVGVGEREEAVSMADRAWEVATAAYGPNHLETAHTLAIRSRALRAVGAVAVSDSLVSEALVTLEATAGPSHPVTVTERWKLAEALNASGRYAEALFHLARAEEGAAAMDSPSGAALRTSVRLETARAHLGLGNSAAVDSLLAQVEAEASQSLTAQQLELLESFRRDRPAAR